MISISYLFEEEKEESFQSILTKKIGTSGLGDTLPPELDQKKQMTNKERILTIKNLSAEALANAMGGITGALI